MSRLYQLTTAFAQASTNSHEIAYLTDANHKIITVSDEFIREFQINEQNSLIGRKIVEVDCLTFYQRHKSQMEKIQMEVIQNISKLTFFQIMMDAHCLRIYIVNYYPVLDLSGNVVGVHVQLRKYALTHLIELVFVANNNRLQNRSTHELWATLTVKQQMVLFLHSRHYSYTEIAMWMSIFGVTLSSSSINAYLTTLKKKLGVTNKSELKKLAHESGVMSQIPLGFLKDGVYDISLNRHELVICNNYPLSDRVLLNQFLPFHSTQTIMPYGSLSKSSGGDYLDEFVESFCCLYSHLECLGYVLDNQDNLVALNDMFVNEFVIEYPAECLGRPFYELSQHNDYLSTYRLHAKAFESQNQLVREQKEKQIFLDILQLDSEIKAYIVYKYPILDRRRCCYGIHVEMRKFVLPIIPSIIKAMRGFNVIPTFKWDTPQKLTERQHMILFLYARNYSSSEIALILSENGVKISLGRVNEHLNNLKKKFAASDEEQLRNVALLLGSYNYIPASWLKVGSFNITGRGIDQWVC